MIPNCLGKPLNSDLRHRMLPRQQSRMSCSKLRRYRRSGRSDYKDVHRHDAKYIRRDYKLLPAARTSDTDLDVYGRAAAFSLGVPRALAA
jgi:hypothetical protein